jgi:hypothetical protein
MTNPRAGIIASLTGVSFSLAGFNEILTCISLVIGISIGSVSLVKIIKNNYKK